MRVTSIIAFILTLIGAVNWLLIGLIDFNAVNYLTFGNNMIERIIYAIVGLAGLWMIYFSYVYKPLNNAK